MLSKSQPDVPAWCRWLGTVTSWHAYVREGDAMSWHRTPLGFVLTPVYHAATWLRWKAGRGPVCGDSHCYLTKHWPGGKVLHP